MSAAARQRIKKPVTPTHNAGITGFSAMGDTGLELPRVLSPKTTSVELECAHLCAVGEIPAFVCESSRIAAWNGLSEDLRQRIASLPPEVLAALHALFNGATRKP